MSIIPELKRIALSLIKAPPDPSKTYGRKGDSYEELTDYSDEILELQNDVIQAESDIIDLDNRVDDLEVKPLVEADSSSTIYTNDRDGQDLNLLRRTFIGYITNPLNAPTSAQGTLISNFVNGVAGTQVWHTVTSPDSLWYRECNAGTFTTWRQVATRSWVSSQSFIQADSNSTVGSVVRSGQDLNGLKRSFFGVLTSASNSPSGTTGVLISNFSSTQGSGIQLWQEITNGVNDSFWYRKFGFSTFSPWYQIASRAYVDSVAGSGGVESVTGDGVNNTDPDNPVISWPEASDIGALQETSGSWTPTLVALGGSPTVTYLAQTGRWFKQGSIIHFRIGIQWNAVSGGSGGLRIPLPASLPGLDNVPGAGASINRVSGVSFTGQMVFSIGATHININSMQNDGTFTTVDVSDMDTSGTIYISGFYEEDPT